MTLSIQVLDKVIVRRRGTYLPEESDVLLSVNVLFYDSTKKSKRE